MAAPPPRVALLGNFSISITLSVFFKCIFKTFFSYFFFSNFCFFFYLFELLYMHFSCLNIFLEWFIHSLNQNRLLTKKWNEIIQISNFIFLSFLFFLFFHVSPSLRNSTYCNSSESKPMAYRWTGIPFWSRIWSSTLLSNAFTRTPWIYSIFSCERRSIGYISNSRNSWSDSR